VPCGMPTAGVALVRQQGGGSISSGAMDAQLLYAAPIHLGQHTWKVRSVSIRSVMNLCGSSTCGQCAESSNHTNALRGAAIDSAYSCWSRADACCDPSPRQSAPGLTDLFRVWQAQRWQ
jgi:hypothetical protein